MNFYEIPEVSKAWNINLNERKNATLNSGLEIKRTKRQYVLCAS